MTPSLGVTEFTSSILMVWVIQTLKRAKWFPWIQAGKARASRVASFLLAAAGVAGVQYSWNPGTRALSFTLPTISVAAVAVWHWFNHYAMQEVIYQSTINKWNGSGTAPVSQSKEKEIA